MCVCYSKNSPRIPAATRWNRYHQLDRDEYACSAEQARNRFTAEVLFGQIVAQTPSLQKKIRHHFIKYVDAAYAVGYLNVLMGNWFVTPKCAAWCEGYLQQLADENRKRVHGNRGSGC